MRKGTGTKERISITIDKEILDSINNKCAERTMKISPYIEKLIKLGLKNEDKK